MDTSMSPQERRESRQSLMESMETSWCCVETRQEFKKVRISLNTCRNVTRVESKTGWAQFDEVKAWMKANEFPFESGTDWDQLAELTYQEERDSDQRGCDFSVDPNRVSYKTLIGFQEDYGPTLKDSPSYDKPVQHGCQRPGRAGFTDDWDKLTSDIWERLEPLLRKSRNAPKKCFDAWLSDCALAVMEASMDDLIDLSHILDSDQLPSHLKHSFFKWKKKFDLYAMKRRVNSWDAGEPEPMTIKEAIRAQQHATEEFWDKVPASGLEEDEADPEETRKNFTQELAKFCFRTKDVGPEYAKDTKFKAIYLKCRFPNYTNEKLAKMLNVSDRHLYRVMNTIETNIICSALVKYHLQENV